MDVDVELDDELIQGIRRLAVSHYGDSGDMSVARVAEVALEMRLLWEDRVKGGGNEIEEPITSWEWPSRQPAEQLPTEIQSWLFRRR